MKKNEYKRNFGLSKEAFEKIKNVTYEMSMLFTLTQEVTEALNAFHATAKAQAARSQLGTLEDEIVGDLFISGKKNVMLQDTPTIETIDPDEILNKVTKIEHSSQVTMACQQEIQFCQSRYFFNGIFNEKKRTHTGSSKSD